MKNIFIREAGRLIWDIMEIYHQENLEGLLVTMDIEKTFNSLDYAFVVLPELNSY